MIGFLGRGIWGKVRCMDYILLELLMTWVGKVLEALLGLNSSHHLQIINWFSTR
jgi:hypothetical protein